jgi:hypothetical protein
LAKYSGSVNATRITLHEVKNTQEVSDLHAFRSIASRARQARGRRADQIGFESSASTFASAKRAIAAYGTAQTKRHNSPSGNT